MISNIPSFSIDNNFSHYNTDCIIEENLLSSNTSIYNISLNLNLSDINNEFLNYKESNEIEKQETKKRPFFKIKKKRGRKFNKERKQQEHTAKDDDNIKRKIQVDFLNFVVNFSNDCLRAFSLDKKMYFQKFNREKKIRVAKKYIQEIKNFSIKEIFENMGVSEKYKNYSENKNKENIEKLKGYNWFKSLFEKNYLDFFSLYYNNGQPLKQKTILGEVIKISERTKTFYHLLEKYKESKEYTNILNGVKIFFLEGNDNNHSESDKKDIIDLNEN